MTNFQIRPVRVLISHGHDERALAEAWQGLLSVASMGAITVWYSSDTQPGGGMDVGREWRELLNGKLLESDFVLAIQSPGTAGRPWVMWECGVASGMDRIRGIIPVVYAMGRGDLANPLNVFQVYQGDTPEQVEEIVNRLVTETGLQPNASSLAPAVRAYLERVRLHEPRRPLAPETMQMWRGRFEELLRSGRRDELAARRRTMYASLGRPFVPVEPTVHELLSRAMLDLQQFDATIEEVDYALTLVGDDIDLLHRKALALVERGDMGLGEALVQDLMGRDEALRLNPELASLEGRIYREQWQRTGDKDHLRAAFEAYHRAFEADRTQYFPGANAAGLALELGERDLAEGVYREILATCERLRRRPIVSFWVDFTAGDARLALGELHLAEEEYRKGLGRTPGPTERELTSALKGVRRLRTALGLDAHIITNIETLLKI